jgi:hypothetical protein
MHDAFLRGGFIIPKLYVMSPNAQAAYGPTPRNDWHNPEGNKPNYLPIYTLRNIPEE